MVAVPEFVRLVVDMLRERDTQLLLVMLVACGASGYLLGLPGEFYLATVFGFFVALLFSEYTREDRAVPEVTMPSAQPQPEAPAPPKQAQPTEAQQEQPPEEEEEEITEEELFGEPVGTKKEEEKTEEPVQKPPPVDMDRLERLERENRELRELLKKALDKLEQYERRKSEREERRKGISLTRVAKKYGVDAVTLDKLSAEIEKIEKPQQVPLSFFKSILGRKEGRRVEAYIRALRGLGFKVRKQKKLYIVDE